MKRKSIKIILLILLIIGFADLSLYCDDSLTAFADTFAPADSSDERIGETEQIKGSVTTAVPGIDGLEIYWAVEEQFVSFFEIIVDPELCDTIKCSYTIKDTLVSDDIDLDGMFDIRNEQGRYVLTVDEDHLDDTLVIRLIFIEIRIPLVKELILNDFTGSLAALLKKTDVTVKGCTCDMQLYGQGMLTVDQDSRCSIMTYPETIHDPSS